MSTSMIEREAILARLDAIVREVAAIRRALLATEEPSLQQNNFTRQLLGCLGAESIVDYDFSLDWQRFGA